MTHRYIKVGATVTVLVLAFAGLMWSTFSDGADYFKNVDEVTTNRQAWEGKSLQLHGYVVPGSIMNAAEHARVPLQGAEQPPAGGTALSTEPVIEASYTGIVPDTFQNEAEVVLRGKLTPDGFETAKNGVIAKCPSKYVAQPGAKKAG